MIINEPPDVANDPTFIVNEGATCANCPMWMRSEPLNRDPRGELETPCFGTCRINPPQKPHRMDPTAWPMVDESDWCAQHPYRFTAVNETPEDNLDKPQRPRVTTPGAMGYDPDGLLDDETP